MPLERRTRAKSNDGKHMRPANLDDFRDFLGRLRKGHSIRCNIRVPALVAAMCLADRQRNREPITKQSTQSRKNRSRIVRFCFLKIHRLTSPLFASLIDLP